MISDKEILAELKPVKYYFEKELPIEEDEEKLLLAFIKLARTGKYSYFKFLIVDSDVLVDELLHETGFSFDEFLELIKNFSKYDLTLYYKVFNISFSFIYKIHLADIEIAENFNLAIKSILLKEEEQNGRNKQ